MAQTSKRTRRQERRQQPPRKAGIRRASEPSRLAPLGPDAAHAARVRIRMYRQPFGDAFLLTLYSESEPHHVLVDCGGLHRVQHERRWSQEIVQDVAHAT